MINIQSVKETLYQKIPWTLSLIGIIESNNYKKLICEKNNNYIAVENQWNEWICYIDSKEHLNTFLKEISNCLNKNRVIAFSKENMFTDLKDETGKIIYDIEDFMYYMPSSFERIDYNLAKESDIPSLSMMQADYCMEEVGWKPYHLDSMSYWQVYIHRIKDRRIFLDDSRQFSKVEITDIYNGYGRISAVYTIPTKRGQGLSGRCLRSALSWAQENRIKLCLNVRQDNLPAKAIYVSAGFQLNGSVLYMKMA